MPNLLDLPLPRTAGRLVGEALIALPDRVKLRLSGGSQVEVDGQRLDPGMQLVLRLMELRGSADFVRPGAIDPVAERRRVRVDARRAQPARTRVGAVRELEVPGGNAALPARHYAPGPNGASGPLPLLVYVHGGGWVVGDLDTHDEVCRILSRQAQMHVLSVDYSLAPEHPFPAAVEDVLAATRWALEHAKMLGADPARVAVGGDSAGGNLAAVTSQTLRDEGGPQVALQVLIYPGTDFVHTWPSKQMFASGFYLTRSSLDWCRERYLPPGVDPSDPRASPLRGNLSNLPPAIVVTAGFDPLRDEGEAYALALREAGNDVVLERVPGVIHGFISMTGVSRAARDAAARLAGMIRSRLAARH